MRLLPNSITAITRTIPIVLLRIHHFSVVIVCSQDSIDEVRIPIQLVLFSLLPMKYKIVSMKKLFEEKIDKFSADWLGE
jgi:hypothetical protein